MPHFGMNLPFSVDNILAEGGNKNKSKDAHRANRLAYSCCQCPPAQIRHFERVQCDKVRNCRCKCHGNQIQLSTPYGSGSNSKENGRKRTIFTEKQTTEMWRMYKEGNIKYLNESKRKEIANQLGLGEAQVKRKWQNMRAKEGKSNPTIKGFGTSSVTNRDSVIAMSHSLMTSSQPYARPYHDFSHSQPGAGLSNFQANLKLYNTEHPYKSFPTLGNPSIPRLCTPNDGYGHKSFLKDMFPRLS